MLNPKCCAAGVMAAGLLASLASAGPVDSARVEFKAQQNVAMLEAGLPDYPNSPVEVRPPFFSRQLQQFPGITNGCQLFGTTGFINGPAYRRADNFKPVANSTIHAVRFAGYYRQMASQTNGVSPGGETFEIRFLADNAGVPGSVVAGPFTVTPTIVQDGTFGAGGPPVYDYEATLPTAVNVTGDTCYWLDLRNTGTAGQRWFWLAAPANTGDSYHYYTGADTYAIWDQVATATTAAGDMSFCMDIELQNMSTNPCPKPAVPSACTNPDVNGQPRAGATSGFSSNIFGSTTVSGGSSVAFERAESFKLTSTGNITSVCFYGFWNAFGTAGGGTLGDGYPANPDLKVTYYANDPLTGFPGAELASFVVGQPGVSIIRDTGGPIHVITHPAFQATANTCYHISISYLSDINDPARHARFVWGFSNTTAANADGVCTTRNTTTNPPGAWSSTALTSPARGLSFVFNVGTSTLPNCSPPVATNISCATATPLVIDGAAVIGNNIGVASTVLAPCGFELIYGGVVWYSLVGDGTTVTVTTCNSTLFGDPVMSVWCAPNGCGQPLNCIQSNDDATCSFGALASENTFATVAGQTYYIAMSGAGGASTAFAIQATSNHAPANPPAAACGTFERCELSGLPFDIQEAEPCLDSTNATANLNAACATADTYPAFGMVAAGHNSTFLNGTANTRDFDLWVLPSVAEPTLVTWKINAEFPVFYTFLNFANGCANGSTNIVSAVRLACQDAFLGEATLPSSGLNVLRITVPDFQGLPCPNFNDYRFVVQPVTLGSCCVPFTACQLTGVNGCAAQGGIFTSGATCTPSDPCAGACCTGTSCVLSSVNDCTGVGTTYVAGATSCTPTPCVPAGVCCRGATCTTTITTSAACTASLTGGQTAGAVFATGTNCNTGAVSNSPCCYANYNKANGITVQDIFDFLGDWFASRPYANTGGNGATGTLSVQNIFDFLSDWFNGGCS